MPTENSVVASLNEVRRLERERVRREQEARAHQEAEDRARREAEERAWHDARSRTSGAAGYHPHPGGGRPAASGPGSWGGQPGAHGDPAYGPAAGHGGPGAPFGAGASYGAGDGYRNERRHTRELGPDLGPAGMGHPGIDGGPAGLGQFPGHGPRGPFGSPYAGSYTPTPVTITRTSWKGMILVTLLLGGAGAAGYMKLTEQFQNKLIASERARLVAEDGRNAAIEAKARAEQEGKVKLTTCEDRVTHLTAERERAAAAASLVPAAAIEAPAAPEAGRRAGARKEPARPASRTVAKAERPGRGDRKGDRRDEAADKASAKSAKESAKATMRAAAKIKAPPKKVSDDPLSGLKL